MDKSRLDDGTVLVGFELPAAVAATSVSLVGDFNDWSPTAHPLALLDDGRFRVEVRLPAGRRWRFRYLVDGERWENDWAADDYVSNGLGAEDSVVDLTAIDAVADDVVVDGATVDAVAGAPATLTDADAESNSLSDAEPDTHPTPKRRWWRFWGRRTATEPVPAGA